MVDSYKPFIEKVTWRDIRKKMGEVNKTLTHIIDEIDPDPKKLLLFKASYPFGAESIRAGKLYLPNPAGRMVLLNDATLSNEIKDNLSYNIGTNPVSVIIKNTSEIFMKLKDPDTILSPYGLIQPGRIFSTWRVLSPTQSHQPAFLWHICAGVRNLLMLPKITSASGYKRLKKKFHLHSHVPKDPLSQWDTFREIINHEDFGDPWFCEMIYFGKNWFNHLEDKAWANFTRYLYKCGWDGSEYWRNQFIWDLIFSVIQRNKNLRPNPYIADTVKHLIAMGVGAVPGFSPAIDDFAGPIKKLQEVFDDIYQIDNYDPIMLIPQYFSMNQSSRPIYYFLQNPTTIEFSPKSRISSNKITELFDIKYLLDKYFEEILSGNLNIHGTPINELPQKVKYDYYHTENENYRGIKNTNKIPEEDESFSVSDGKSFPANSPLINGSVKISNNST